MSLKRRKRRESRRRGREWRRRGRKEGMGKNERSFVLVVEDFDVFHVFGDDLFFKFFSGFLLFWFLFFLVWLDEEREGKKREKK